MPLKFIIIAFMAHIFVANSLSSTEYSNNSKLFAIEGRISFGKSVIPKPAWQAETTIYVDYGKFLGFVRYASQVITNIELVIAINI